ncbi:MAG: DNA-directed RNA polymerase subunit omega [Lachnospiraceae bacterium]|nr:DNA-directed RNA polymerase subunit omega [Lachnospiraceae bacterium]
MIHPSYVELMKVVNKDTDDIGEMPVINSRYSIVIASAKRARQIIDGAAPKIEDAENKKPLSVAVEELYDQKVRILGEDEDADEE